VGGALVALGGILAGISGYIDSANLDVCADRTIIQHAGILFLVHSIHMRILVKSSRKPVKAKCEGLPPQLYMSDVFTLMPIGIAHKFVT
jgi:hypothetical protein